MEGEKGMELLFQYALAYRFADFDALFSEMEATLPFEEFGEAYLLRAQIKLFSLDPSFMDDLTMADNIHARPQFDCLNSWWEIDTPHRLAIFSNTPGVLRCFVQSLPAARKILARHYGEHGDTMARQIQCNILYFTGDIQEAFRLAEEPFSEGYDNRIDVLLLKCMQYRCCLALGMPRQAEAHMLEMIRQAKAYPECVAPYLAFRSWANITTSWNGDSPRFLKDSDGKNQPVLDDRIQNIRTGSARMTMLETPFVGYAERHYKDAYPIRQYYMDVFHAMYWLSVKDHQQTESYFSKLYEMATATGIILPIVECGEQIMPLLEHVRNRVKKVSEEWLDRVCSMAQQYEETLDAYRSINM